MEPNAPNAGGGPSPEAGPSLPNIETTPDQAEHGQIEAAPAPAAPEVDRPAGEGANQNQGMVLPTPVPQPVEPPAQSAPAKTDDEDQKQPDVDAPDLANDVDVIEKEWVDKAKEIVDDSKDDPYRQNHNVSVLKADYMKKRYGKDIKIPDDKPAKV